MHNRRLLLGALGAITVATSLKPRAADGADLHWIDGGSPAITPSGSAFGVPWAQGQVNKTTTIAAIAKSGKSLPLQTWPLAYWPDGSLKWTGHAFGADSGLEESLNISPGTPAQHSSPISVLRKDSTITITTGNFKAVFNSQGDTPIKSLQLDGITKAKGGQLVAHIQSGPEPELSESAPSVQVLTGNIESAVVEQEGPVRAVVKFTGTYSGGGHASILPFTLRLYVAAGGSAVRAVHFFVYDGDQNKDFIKGLGLTISAPLSDELYNRHVRFGSALGGILGEAVLGLSGLRRDATATVLDPQFEGKAVPDRSTWPTTISSAYTDLPVWADWQLDQLTSESFAVRKRTDKGKKVSWLPAGDGTRAAGTGYIGGATAGGLSWAHRESWQRAPTGVDVRGLTRETADVTVWAYTPRAPALDLRHYDTTPHGLDLTYEDVGNPDPDPVGVGRSYEVTLQVFATTPSREDLGALSAYNTKIPQLVASPEFYVSHKLFGGHWNVVDTSRSGLAAVEKRKNDLLDFYVSEVEQRKWYGFWDYGDVMHTYDSTRHVWRYDVGGYAWDNGELGTDLWLWTSFLRTGRADIFRLASALTRHLSEVDSHHIGTYVGLGSRHHVTHWGDGAKEARVAGSALRRPYLYITADELIGDLIETTLQADTTIVRWEPLRKVENANLPNFTTPGRIRLGPDWTTLAGNWFTQWERTGNSTWLERIKVGMRDIGAFKTGLFTGYASAVGWDPATAHLTDIGGAGTSTYHLALIFGGGEFLMELVDTVKDVPEFDAAFVEFSKLYNAPAADKIARYNTTSWIAPTFTNYYMKLQAYAGERLNDTSLKQAAWDVLKAGTGSIWSNTTRLDGTDVLNPTNEIKDLVTNDAAQVSLSEYAVIAIAPELAPN